MTISIRKNSIPYFIMIIPYTPIEFVSHIFPTWGTFCSIARILILLFLLYRFVVIWERITVPLILAILFFGAGLLSTLLAGDSLYTLLYYGIYMFGITLLVEDGVFYDVDAMLAGLLLWFEILVYANLLYYIINPSGFSEENERYHLLGNYNTVVRKLFPGIIIGALQAFRLKGKITLRFGCMYFALLIYLLLVGAVTAYIGMLIFLIGIVYYSFRKKTGIFKFEIFLVISAALSVIFAVVSQFSFFQWFITFFLGKDMTISNRVSIWERTLRAIPSHPIFGYGQLSRTDVGKILHGSIDPHNILLGVLFFGGIVGLIVLAIILIVVGKKIHDCRKNTYAASLVAVFEAGYCAYFIMWVFEPFACINEFYKIFFFFVLAYHCLDFVKAPIPKVGEKYKTRPNNKLLGKEI